MSTPPDLGPLPEPRYLLAVDSDGYNPGRILTESGWSDDQMRDFGQRCYMLGVAAEREACAKVCDVTPPYPFRPSIEAAHAIRQRARTAAPSEPTKEGG